MRCPRCQHENAPGMKFCGECGTPLTANPSRPPAPSYAEITSALTEALEQQTATSEILRVISSSPTDIQPVFGAMLTSAARLCDASDATIFRVMPMRKAHRSVGALVVARPTVGAFTDVEVAPLRTFADQAVIAIENVRLFTELQEKNRALTEAHAQVTEALEQQTATADILKVISSSPTNVQPVFEAIAESAARLTNALFGGTFLVADGMLSLAAIHTPDDVADAFRRSYPIPLALPVRPAGRSASDQCEGEPPRP